MSGESLEQRVLAKASECAGGAKALARELRVPLRDLAMFMDGSERPTKAVFLAACDLVIAHSDADVLNEVVLGPGSSVRAFERKVR